MPLRGTVQNDRVLALVSLRRLPFFILYEKLLWTIVGILTQIQQQWKVGLGRPSNRPMMLNELVSMVRHDLLLE